MSEAKLHRHEQVPSDFLDLPRDVVVWTPPGYGRSDDRSDERSDDRSGERSDGRSDGRSDDRSGKRYPVLYMHDGQNLFEPEAAFKKGETWRVGETAAALATEARIEPPIIVGIYNTGERRNDEYAPTRDAKVGGGRAGDYARFIIDELKPLIDREYRTRPDATGLAGSSLGGLATLHIAFTHPTIFDRVAALSPSVWWDRRVILRTIRQMRSKPKFRIWADMGTDESTRGIDDARLLKAALVGLGFSEGVDLHYAEYEGATHSEESWAARFGAVLEWLYPPREN